MKNEHLQSDNTIDVIHSSFLSDYELFFGPLNDTAKPFVSDASRTSDLLVNLGLASSKGWCKKNGWDRALIAGYQEFYFGALKYKICVLNQFNTDKEN